ncbi:MAG TPA: ATP-binding protein [Mycobacteriales bacterium]|nr:ATP-binding protein [Mycobacteriales bacterium]
MRIPRLSRLTLAALAGGSVALACVVVVSAVVVSLTLLDELSPAGLTLIAGVGACGAAVAGLLGGVAADKMVLEVRALRSAAQRRLQDGPDLPGTVVRSSFSELNDLAATIDGLAVRARVADEVAERHRRSAANASAGMFELLSGLVAAEEGARGQLAAELHDTAAQSLALARAELCVGDSEAIRRATDYVADAEEQVRAVMARTRPPALRDGDLATAIDNMRRELDQRYALQVDVRWPEEAHPLPLVSAITIYRFFQESLLNVVKHADVDWAVATLDIDDEWVTATVADEGPGFDPAAVRSDKGRHVGLGLLRERARLAGGSVDVASMPSAGTTLRLRLPRTGVPSPRSAAEQPAAATAR